MRGGSIGIGLRGLFAMGATLAALGCGPSPITSTRVAGAIALTFANLMHVQVARLGLSPMSASDFGVTGTCRRLVTGSDSGSGEWACTLFWHGPSNQRLSDTYELSVSTDGCYTATVDGEELGGPTIKAPDGSDIRNLLYAFEGCFDTT
jgi:hypothetical protein